MLCHALEAGAGLMRVLYIGPVLPEYVAALEALLGQRHALETVARIGPHDRDSVQQADVLLGLGLMNAETITWARRTRLIQVLGAGYDNVDLRAAGRAGIPVATTGASNAVSVAEHAFGLLLSVVRRISLADRRIRDGDWPQFEYYQGGLHELAGRTIGLVGCGHVGQALARMARGFDMRLLYYQRHRLPSEREREIGATYVGLDDLLARADVVSVQVPLTETTRGLIGANELARMKPNAVLVNVSRGAVLDQAALIEALQTGRLAGAGLDVFEREPLEPDSPLRQLDGVVLTPHVGGAAEEAVQRTFEVAVDNILRLDSGEPLQHLVSPPSN